MPAITIPIEIELTAQSKALIGAIMGAIIKSETEDAPAAQPARAVTATPAIGQLWLGLGGIYAGIARGFDGEPDGHLVLLDAVPDKELTWADAIAWAQGLGDGSRLPTRFESSLLYANLQDKINTSNWYWTGSQYSDSNAWFQTFHYGYQNYDDKKAEGRCRAVRRFDL